MFGNLGNLKNLAGMLGNMGEMKEKFEKVQEELGRKTVEGDAGAGAVRVVANGKLEVLSIRFDKVMLATLAGEGNDVDQQMVEDLVTGAVNVALAKARGMIQEEIGKATGGMNIPGLEQMLGS